MEGESPYINIRRDGTMNDLEITFDLLLDEMKRSILVLHEQMKDAVDHADYARVTTLVEAAQKMTSYLGEIERVEADVAALLPGESPEVRSVGDQSGASNNKQHSGRLAKGLRTPDSVYIPLLLAALAEMGGRGTIQQVTDRVGERMRDDLNEYDLQTLPSDPDTLRWRNAVAWVRQTLIEQGLMRKDSPRGIWELSDEGRDQAARQ
jgi:restriction system protein